MSPYLAPTGVLAIIPITARHARVSFTSFLNFTVWRPNMNVEAEV